jgi:hypothetical protein
VDLQQMCTRASLIRLQMHELMRQARIVAEERGKALKLPALRRSHRDLIEDCETALAAMAPLAAALRARGIKTHEHLPRQIELFKQRMAQGRPSRKPKTLSAVLTAGWAAAVQLKPLHEALFRTDYNRLFIWKKVRWTGAARRAKNLTERGDETVTRSARPGRRRTSRHR